MHRLNRTRFRRLASFVTVVVLLVGALVLAKGCSAVVRPPVTVDEPVTVYIVVYGRHPSLALPQSDGVLVEYGYGEWEWFAMNRTGGLSVFRALLLPTTGALGRRYHETDTEPGWNAALVDTSIVPLRVEREDANALRDRLDRRFDAAAATAWYNARRDMDFVKDPQRYSALTNSNMVTADWLEELGCEVTSRSLYPARWRVLPREPE